MPMREARVIALAGVFQGCRLVHRPRDDAARPTPRAAKRASPASSASTPTAPPTCSAASPACASASKQLIAQLDGGARDARDDAARARRRAPRAKLERNTAMRDALRNGIESIARQVQHTGVGMRGRAGATRRALLRDAFARAPARDRARKSGASRQSARRRADPRDAARRRARGGAVASGRRRAVSVADSAARVRDAGARVAGAVHAGSRVRFVSSLLAGSFVFGASTFVIPARMRSGCALPPSFRRAPSLISSFRRKPESIWLCLCVSRASRNRLTSLCASSAILAAESLSLACARESNQRKHTLGAAPSPSARVRYGRPGFG